MRRLRSPDLGYRRNYHAHSKLPLTAWFWAAYLMTTHSNGISALQLQRQLALGSYKTAWLLCAKLRQSMLAPGRIRLSQVDDYSAACLHSLLTANLAPGATAKTDGWSGYPGAGITHDPHVVGKMAAHIVLRWFHRIFPISRSGLWVSITACVASTSNLTSMNSFSASIAGAPEMPHSDL